MISYVMNKGINYSGDIDVPDFIAGIEVDFSVVSSKYKLIELLLSFLLI